MAANTSPTRVIIIGAGLSGIAAAITLSNAGIPVLLLERTSRLGGRAGSTPRSNGTSWPIGSHLYLGCCHEYISLLKTLGSYHLTYQQPRLRLVVAHDGRMATLQAHHLPNPLSLAPSFLKHPFLSVGDKAAVARGIAAILANAPARPGETWAEWLNRHRQPPAARKFIWELISAPTLNAPAEEASADLALMVFKLAVLGRGGAATLGFLPLDAESLLTPVGTYLHARQSELRLATPVEAIVPAGESQRILVKTRQGALLAADAVISATPYRELIRLLPMQWREHPFFQNLRALPPRPIVDVFLTYDTHVLHEPVVALTGLPALWVFSHSTPSGGQQLCISISCPGDLARQPTQHVLAWTKRRLAESLGIPLSEHLVDARVLTHKSATFSAAPEHQSYRPNLLSPMANLVLAGDYTTTGWPATMEGAVRSGIRAATYLMHRRSIIH